MKPIAAVFIFILLGIGLITFISTEKYYNQLNNEYSLVELQDSINGEVAWKEENHGFIYLRMKDSTKITLYPSTNYEYKPPFLDNFIVIGDTVRKERHSDSIKVVRNNEVYLFLFNKVINSDNLPTLF